MYKLISTSLAIALTSVSIGWAGSLELEAMEEEAVMVAEEPNGHRIFGRITWLLLS